MSEQTDSPSDTTASQLRLQLAEIYGLPATATEQDILKYATDLRDRQLQEAADEVEIKKKTDAGLTRAQATAVITRQRAHDALLAKDRAERLPVLLDLISKNRADMRTARLLAREQFPALDGSEWAEALSSFDKASA